MLLSAAEKDSGIIPGPRPTRVKIDALAFQKMRNARHWSRFANGIAGLADIAPVDITPSVFDTSSIQPVDITPQVVDPYSTGSSDTSPMFVTVTPSILDTNPTPTLPAFATPTAPNVPAPSFDVQQQAPANPTQPAAAVSAPGSSTDWAGDLVKLATVAGQTFVGITAAQRGLQPPGVTGIMPGPGVGAGPLTAAQLALMTPAQRAQYATMYPGTGAASPTDFLSTLLGTGSGTGPSLTEIMLLGGVGLLAFMMISKSSNQGRR